MAKNGTSTKRKPGRPKREIDLKQVYRLSKKQLTDAELAARLGFNVTWFCEMKGKRDGLAEAILKGKSDGRGELREKIFDMAMNDECPKQLGAAIWLSKQYLGMSDKATQEISGPGGKPIEHKVTHDVKALKEMPDEELKAYYLQHIAGRNGRFN